ncbi:hypothetical protein BaRGS_00023516 [Batillaria attramentaria]|uniref:Uncharacterized protein n=1 Tax=Batillaria attramentaria TaxID=370345 RepID=A0ABD0KDS3_9CAEN
MGTVAGRLLGTWCNRHARLQWDCSRVVLSHKLRVNQQQREILLPKLMLLFAVSTACWISMQALCESGRDIGQETRERPGTWTGRWP